MSHPPVSLHGSAASDLAHFFHPSTVWDNPWYEGENLLPPILHGDTHHMFAASWEAFGADRAIYIGVLFSDLSICWASVQYSTSSHASPNDLSLVKRKAQFIARPTSMDQAGLIKAHETYGEEVAAFAELYISRGTYCGRGECWDLANEALKAFEPLEVLIPKPVPSVSRTHGHLIFEGKAFGIGNTKGRWRGGDDMVRRGDIVEWRRVKINFVGARPTTWALLGDPDHTAIIVSDSKPTRRPMDGQAFNPADLVSLEVVEQSVGSPPACNVYDMRAFEEGEMWIYRPVGMDAYLGTLFAAKCPPTTRVISI